MSISDREIINTFKSMGYRMLGDNIVAKPVGYHLFSYNINENTLANYFRSAQDGKLALYRSIELDKTNEESLLEEIMQFESNTSTRVFFSTSNYSPFNWLDK